MFDNHNGRTRLSAVCWLHATRQQDEVTLTLQGEFDLAGELRFRQELGLHLDDMVARLVLDLRGLTFIDSTGLGMLLALDGIARSDDFELAIVCSTHGAVRMVLRETGLDGVLPVEDAFGAVPATDSPV
jgi:anti-anti-sigma factor